MECCDSQGSMIDTPQTKSPTDDLPQGTFPNLCSDLCVLDLTRVVAGNITSNILADLGARVIKVEKPDGGDSLRNWTCEGVETWWKVYGRGKESLALELRSAEGMEVLKSLVPTSNILIENFKPGTLEKMGLSPEELWKLNPSLIILRISGWGQTGPFSHKPGFGSLIEAFSGFAAMNGYADRPPVLPPFAMADAFAGVFGAVGILAAARAGEKSKRGEVIDLSLLEPLFSVLGPIVLEANLMGHSTKRQGSRSPTHAPRNVYETADNRWLALSAGTESMVQRLFKAMDKPELIDDTRFNTHAARIENIDALDAEISAFSGSRNLDDLVDLFDKTGVTAGAVMDAEDLMQSDFIKERAVLVAQPDHELDTIPSPHPPLRCQNASAQKLKPAPLLGEHTATILSALGYDPEAQAAMEQKGAAGFLKKEIK